MNKMLKVFTLGMVLTTSLVAHAKVTRVQKCDVGVMSFLIDDSIRDEVIQVLKKKGYNVLLDKEIPGLRYVDIWNETRTFRDSDVLAYEIKLTAEIKGVEANRERTATYARPYREVLNAETNTFTDEILWDRSLRAVKLLPSCKK